MTENGLNSEDRARMVGLLYLTVAYDDLNFETWSKNFRKLTMELRTAITLSDEPNEVKNKDLAKVAACNKLWRTLVFDKIDKNQVEATMDNFELLDEISVLVEGKYGKLEVDDYVKIMKTRTEAT